MNLVAALSTAAGEEPKKVDAVVCGYGRVGTAVCTALQEAGLTFAVVDEQVENVRAIRARGVEAVIGDASHPIVLERAGVAQARLVVVAIPDNFDVRATVDHVRAAAPGASIIARSHRVIDCAELVQRGASHAFVGEIELARSMARAALDALEVPEQRVRGIIASITSAPECGE